ncbi:leucine-rich repeat domain-containing protein [Crateriforma conspicua]|uniref:hypothetical protein n=1 Tax=Crateriforma conspicua TaxID=2527996 RepID=UPI00118D1E26|nr:hypothetical protein [Crateriforma conspicua]QDV61827.1 Leucine Rich repeats (2 copies) [Crateriforma conspicua]
MSSRRSRRRRSRGSSLFRWRRWKNPIRFDPSASDYQKAAFEIALAVTLALLVILNLPFQHVAVLTEGQYDASAIEFPINVSTLEPPSKAGWPFSFYSGHSFGAQSIGKWNLLKLAADFLVGVALMVAVGLYFWPRRQHLRRAKRWKRKATYSVATAAAAIAIFAYFAVLHAHYLSDQSAAKKLRERGQVVQMAFLPRIVAPITPDFLARSRMRIVLASLAKPDDDLLDLALQQNELRSLRLFSGTYDEAKLRRLPTLRYLQDLSVRKHGIAPETLETWANCRILSQINLSDCPVSDDSLRPLSQIERISRLCLLGTDTTYGGIGDVKSLRRRIRELILECPEYGSEIIQVREWSNLRRIALLRRKNGTNPDVLSMSVADCPTLESILVSPRQRISFSARDLSVFRGVYAVDDVDLGKIVRFRGPSGPPEITTAGSDGKPSRPLAPWVTNTSLFDCDGLESLVLDAKSIGIFTIEKCKDLKYLVLLGSKAGLSRDADVPPIDRDVRQKLLQSLAEFKDPEQVALPGMKLDDVKLEPLTYNVNIKRLDLTGAQIDLASMRTLESMIGLQELNLTAVPLTPKTFAWINHAFASLVRLTISPEAANALAFSDHEHLAEIRIGDFQSMPTQVLGLVRLPRFRTPMLLSDQSREVRIKDVPELGGLGIPNQCECEISGVKGLQWFASGGTNCDDTSVSEVLQADQMKRLAIIRPVAAADSFGGMKQMKLLRQVDITGCPLGDEFLNSWDVPASLNTLVLDECLISDAAIPNLLSCGQLQGLGLAKTDLSESMLQALGRLERLKALGLSGLDLDGIDEAGRPIGSPALESFAGLEELRYLDLSECKLPSNAIDVLAKYPALRVVNLRGCGLSEEALQSLRLAKPDLLLDDALESHDFLRLLHRPDDRDDSVPGYSMPDLDRSQFPARDASDRDDS